VLTPHAQDPNRKSELERKAKDPMSFGNFNQADRLTLEKDVVESAKKQAATLKTEK
jgi:hypothetical protein